MNATLPPGLTLHTRTGRSGEEPELFEKTLILPELTEKDPAKHAWTEALYTTDVMAEHALFFSLLMPEELASKERKEAVAFQEKFSEMNREIKLQKLAADSLSSFVTSITDEMKRFIEYKQKQHEAQLSGQLRSLVWPLFFEHTKHEAERSVRRLEQIAQGNTELERSEVIMFWSEIMDEHARFIAHLLDPDEFALIEKAMNTSKIFRELQEKGEILGVVTATVKEPITVVGSLQQNPEMDAILSAAETILDFKTQAARDIEKARIKSIIDPRLADHVRREATKFVDELKRAE